jgi:site-specific DNA recombinase
MTRKLITYARCSTSEQAEDGHSLDVQRDRMESYAAALDLEIVHQLEDPGASGKSFGGLDASLDRRPGLRRALQLLERGEAHGLLIFKLDRLTRDTGDLTALLRRHFTDAYDLISVSEQIDTRTASGRMTVMLLTTVAQWERETISERTKAALSLKKKRGEFCGGEPPLGWRRAGKARLAPCPKEQDAIVLARAMRGRGQSLREIGQLLDQEVGPTRGGGAWSPASVSRLIKAQHEHDGATQRTPGTEGGPGRRRRPKPPRRRRSKE